MGALPLDKPFAAVPAKGRIPTTSATAADAGAAKPQLDSPEDTTAVTGFEAGESVELAIERAQFSRVFENPDGTRTAKFGSHPLNYRAADSSWQPIVPPLVIAWFIFRRRHQAAANTSHYARQALTEP